MTIKKTVDLSKLEQDKIDDLSVIDKNQSLSIKGIAGDHLLEPVPDFIVCKNEKVIKGSNNCFIVLGRDRPSSRISGYGGKGSTGCGTIDLVAGRLSSIDLPKGKSVFANNDFANDAARIYISQKTDIDKNFKLVNGSIGDSKTRSGIGIKADAIRLIGREGIKLITEFGTVNSQGGNISRLNGIDLIAGNDDTDLQPIAKGKNVALCLEEILNSLSELDGILDAFVNIQSRFNETLTHHFHISPFFGIPNSPSPAVVQQGIQTAINTLTDITRSTMSFKNNIRRIQMKYVESSGPNCVKSRWNNTN
jgi:hypothetical protein